MCETKHKIARLVDSLDHDELSLIKGLVNALIALGEAIPPKRMGIIINDNPDVQQAMLINHAWWDAIQQWESTNETIEPATINIED